MTSGFRSDKQWSDKFITKFQMVAGLLITSAAPIEEDALRNTDLIVLTARSVRIACRVRRHKYYLSNPFDFTIRSSRDSGAETELSKILSGWGDYLIYGFSNQAETNLEAWRIIDLDCFRRTHAQLKKQSISNGDGTHFDAFDVRTMPTGIVVYTSRKK